MCKTIASSHKLSKILSSLGNGPTRRNLFGPVDREQLQLEYQEALRKDLEEASQRWSFDFFSDKPLEGGDFQWECVPGTKVPLLYRSSMVGLGQAERQRVVGAAAGPSRVRAGPSQSEDRSPGGCVVNFQKLEKTSEKVENNRLKRKQTNITDFYQAKRRVDVGTPRKSCQ